MIYRVELRDRDMNFITILDNRIKDIVFSFSPIGGCADFSFKALSKYCTELNFGANYNVRISMRNDATKNYDLIYQGRVENIVNDINYSDENIQIQGFGYQSQLSDIVINATYTSTEVSAIIKDLLDTYIVPNTDLTYDLADLENTGFTPDTITFSYVPAIEAFEKLAEITGNIEWGVDKNRKVYFKRRSDIANFFEPLGKYLSDFKINSSSREIVNRVIVIGAEVSGSKFTYVKDYAKSQRKYKRRDKVIQNSAVTTNQVAEQLADAKYAAGKGMVDRGSFVYEKEFIWETSLPVPLVKIQTREITYDEKAYDTFLYAGQEPFRILKIKYKIDDSSRLSSNVDFGQKTPDIIEGIKQLEFRLNNVVQSGA